MKKIINFRPTLFAALSLAAGLFFSYFIVLGEILFAVASVFTFVSCVVFYLIYFASIKEIKRGAIIALVLTAFFAAGFLSFRVTVKDYVSADLDGHYFNVTARIKERCDTDDGAVVVLDKVELEGIATGKSRYKIYAVVSGDLSADMGDEISFSATLYDRSLIYDNRFAAENIADGIKYSAYIGAGNVTVVGDRSDIFQKTNLFIRESLKKGLDGDEFAVAYAMLTGTSEYMSDETLTSYRSAGIAHLFAVSGLHIGFVSSLVYFVLKKLNARKGIVPFVVFFACLFYSGVCGFSASSLRATIMCFVSFSVRAFGERYDGLSSVSFSAIIVLLLFPMQLFCVGFRLSFGVVYGMILLSKPFSSLLGFLPKKAASSLGAVLAAQIVAIPVSLSAFGTFSIISVAANLLFIPASGVIFTALLLLSVIGGAFGVSYYTLFILKYVLTAVNVVINAIDYRFFIAGGFTVGAFSTFYYAALIVPSGILNLKRITKTVVALFCAVVCVAGSVIYNVADHNAVKVYMRGTGGVSYLVASCEDTNIMVIADAGSRMSLSTFKSFSDKTNITRLDCVVVLNKNLNFSLQRYATKLNGAFDICEILYYGERREKDEFITLKSFPEIKCFSIETERVKAGLAEVRYAGDGIGVIIEIKDKTIAVLHEFGDVTDYGNFPTGEYDFMAACDYAERINDLFKPKKFAKFRADALFDNGETQGLLCVRP